MKVFLLVLSFLILNSFANETVEQNKITKETPDIAEVISKRAQQPFWIQHSFETAPYM